jgi:hypothetical protein
MGALDKFYKETQGLVETGTTLATGAGSTLIGNVAGVATDISRQTDPSFRSNQEKIKAYANWLNTNRDKADTEDYKLVLSTYNDMKESLPKPGEQIASEFAERFTYEPVTSEGKRNLEVLGDLVSGSKIEGLGPQFQMLPTKIPFKGKPKTVLKKPKEVAEVDTASNIMMRAGNLFQKADEAKITFNPNAQIYMADAIEQALIDNKISRISKVGNDAREIAKKIRQRGEKGQNMSMQDYMEIRDAFDDLINLQKPKTGRVSKIATNALDDFVENADEFFLSGGDDVSIATFKRAREKYGQAKKTADVEEMLSRAERTVGSNYTDAGLADALRKEFKKLLNSKSRRKYFKQSELDIMDDFVKNDQATLKALSKLDASTGSAIPQMGNLATAFSLGTLFQSPEIGAITYLSQLIAGKGSKMLRNQKAKEQLVRMLGEIQGQPKGRYVTMPGLDIKQVPTGLLMLPPVTSQNKTVQDIISGSLL